MIFPVNGAVTFSLFSLFLAAFSVLCADDTSACASVTARCASVSSVCAVCNSLRVSVGLTTTSSSPSLTSLPTSTRTLVMVPFKSRPSSSRFFAAVTPLPSMYVSSMPRVATAVVSPVVSVPVSRVFHTRKTPLAIRSNNTAMPIAMRTPRFRRRFFLFILSAYLLRLGIVGVSTAVGSAEATCCAATASVSTALSACISAASAAASFAACAAADTLLPDFATCAPPFADSFGFCLFSSLMGADPFCSLSFGFLHCIRLFRHVVHPTAKKVVHLLW